MSQRREKNVRKRKGRQERELPSKLDVSVASSQLYSQLLMLEQRLDSTIARKHADIQDALRTAPKATKTLRLFIWNEYDNQHAFQKPGGDVPGWTLKIQGTLVEPQNQPSLRVPSLCLSNFVSKLFIQLDPVKYPDSDGFVEWRKGFGPALTDGFEMKRKGNADTVCKITIYMDYCPPRYKLPKSLGKLIGVEVGSRNAIITALWQYAKKHDLCVSEQGGMTLNPNKELSKILGKNDPIPVPKLVETLRPLFSPPDPFVFKHTIRVSGESSETVANYDVEVDWPDSFNPNRPLIALQKTQERQREIARLDDKIAEMVSDISKHVRRSEFLSTFADAPNDTIDLLVAHQSNHLERAVSGPADRAEVFHQEWVPEAVERYLRDQLYLNPHLRTSTLGGGGVGVGGGGPGGGGGVGGVGTGHHHQLHLGGGGGGGGSINLHQSLSSSSSSSSSSSLNLTAMGLNPSQRYHTLPQQF